MLDRCQSYAKKIMRSPAAAGLTRRPPRFGFLLEDDPARQKPVSALGSGPRAVFRRARSILPVKPDQFALNLDPVRRQDADFIGGVGRLQCDRGASAAEAF